MRFLYNLAAILIVTIIIPIFVLRATRERGFIERIKQSFGFYPQETIEKVAGKNAIWVHAASVGEIVATSPLVREFRKVFPDSPILVSVVTTGGYEMAHRIIKDADAIIYFPLDLPFLASRVVGRIRPRVFLPVETELWPNFLKKAKQLDVPVMMVNGRISDRSVKQYKYLFGMLREMIGTVKCFAMQSSIDADYIMRLGAPRELVTVTGNTKFDQAYTSVSAEERAALIEELGLSGASRIMIAGSTHRGEEELVLAAFKAVREKDPGVRLIIAPREVLRTLEVEHLCRKAGFTVTTRKELQKGDAARGEDIVILDTVGELGRVYGLGDVIYIGGSLIPHGGHNILEPAAHGKAIIVGNQMFNFKDIHALFRNRNAVVTVASGEELTRETLRLFGDAAERARLEAETLAIINENKGASEKSARILVEMLETYESRRSIRAQERIVGHRVRATQKVANFQTYFIDLVHDKEVRGISRRLIMGVFYVFSLIYEQLVNLKLTMYRWGWAKKERLGCYVISLGNVTVGGTGKTPTAQHLAREISDMGYRVAILNRGYRAKWRGEVGIVSDGHTLKMDAETAGDEAFMLAKHLPNVPVLIGAQRAVTGRYAIEHFGAEVAILDDGYQHWQLARDMDILLVDAVNVFGNGYLLPRGTLREPLSHIDRADVCLMTKVDQAAPGAIAHIWETFRSYNQDGLILESIHQPRQFVRLSDWYEDIAAGGVPVTEMEGKKVLAVSAIGNPASFEQTLADLGIEMVESMRYPDHHDYGERDMAEVLYRAETLGVEAIVITEKDAVKVPGDVVRAKWRIPMYVISVEVTLQKGREEFFQELKRQLAEKLRGGDMPS
ncbi:tetraacyldisaccharide 4'-kinase [Selenomonas sp. oral taxon 137 str. F0430]|uniref:tetraacyldisaccharide 4'-kinase n=1 Tax=Selenomonas sp. oral taxon 137 TaxID=712531 RepID=UPI0001EB1638|nr:tetraacyldisaccharide 4'-kinase [Selenomonas sp. oral taxon 137]EFR41368.1 tetraacyldisaccharide 4'-kinase [Selenomonas sp. oral taxon 137 str. F0430]